VRNTYGGLQVLDGVFRNKKVTAGGGVAPTVANVKVNEAAGNASSLAITFDSEVTNGKLVVVAVAGNVAAEDVTYTAGMLTKTAGTSTIGTVALDITIGRAAGSDDNNVAIYSIPVTGTGTLTLTFNKGTGGSSNFLILVGAEVTSVDVSGTRVNATASDNNNSDTAGASGNVATGGAGIIFGMLAPGPPFGTITAAQDGSFTLIDEMEDDAQLNYSFIYRSVTGDTTDSADVTWGTSCDWIACAVAYKSSSP
jgi:hypothetical protein